MLAIQMDTVCDLSSWPSSGPRPVKCGRASEKRARTSENFIKLLRPTAPQASGKKNPISHTVDMSGFSSVVVFLFLLECALLKWKLIENPIKRFYHTDPSIISSHTMNSRALIWVRILLNSLCYRVHNPLLLD